MFCTKCGALIYEGERFCLKCGSPVKNGDSQAQAQYVPQPPRNDAEYDPYVVSITPERAAEIMNGQTTETKPSSKKKIVTAMVAVLALIFFALVAVGLLSNCLGANTPEEMINALLHKDEQEDGIPMFVTPSDAAIIFPDDSETTTTAAPTTTTTTTTTTTAPTTSQQDLLLLQAKEINDLLVSKKWKTTLEGYDALITFNDDGTALIEVNVKLGFFNVAQKVNANYEITPQCFAKIVGEYNGKKYGISGVISKVSSSELRVDRGGDKGIVTLKEAK